MLNISVVWNPNLQVICKRHQRHISIYGHRKTLPQCCRVCGNPTVTYTLCFHSSLSFLSCFLCLFWSVSSNSTCLSKTKHCLVKLYGKIWSRTQHLHSKALATMILTPKQGFTWKLRNARFTSPWAILILLNSILWCVEWRQICSCLCSKW